MKRPPPAEPFAIHIPSTAQWLRRRRLKRIVIGAAIGVVVVIALAVWYNHRGPVPMTEIFQGVTYTCEKLPDSPLGGGLMHIVEVDLNAPGIELYVTPIDTDALAQGWEYHLRSVGSVARAKNLAVVINAALFQRAGGLFSTNDLARGLETVVSEHHVNHVNQDTYLLWFEDDLTPHLETAKPPSPEALRRARWGVGSQGVMVNGGVANLTFLGSDLDLRTAVGIDPARKRLWLAVFERASQKLVASELVRYGAKQAVMFDGGNSTAMAIGPGAAGMRSGTVLGGWRNVATQFGVRAREISR